MKKLLALMAVFGLMSTVAMADAHDEAATTTTKTQKKGKMEAHHHPKADAHHLKKGKTTKMEKTDSKMEKTTETNHEEGTSAAH